MEDCLEYKYVVNLNMDHVTLTEVNVHKRVSHIPLARFEECSLPISGHKPTFSNTDNMEFWTILHVKCLSTIAEAVQRRQPEDQIPLRSRWRCVRAFAATRYWCTPTIYWDLALGDILRIQPS